MATTWSGSRRSTTHGRGIPRHYIPPQVRNWMALREVFSGGTPAGATVTRTPGQITVQFANGERFVFHING